MGETPPKVETEKKRGIGTWIALGCGGAIVLVVVFAICVGVLGTLSETEEGTEMVATETAGQESEREETTTAPPEPERSTSWAEVASWSGSGIKQTESFETKSREWRISWETSNEAFAGAGIFQVMVHDADTDALVTLAANQQGVGSDVSYVRSSPGRYYLMMNSGNVDWTVTVEDQR